MNKPTNTKPEPKHTSVRNLPLPEGKKLKEFL